MNHVQIRDLQLIDYQEAWNEQEQLFNTLILSKQHAAPQQHHLLLCEHPHVYTLGQRGNANNMLISSPMLQSIGASLVRTNRGGDITYHGPGQIVAYPICDLESLGLSLRTYIERLEQAVINMLQTYGIAAGRLHGATGVWLEAGLTGRERKICAIGVKASRHITMHGLALNVNTDMRYFQHINPCGFADKRVTSMAQELGRSIDMAEAKQCLAQKLAQCLNLTIINPQHQ